MAQTTRLVATTLALLLVTSTFGSIGAATNTNGGNEVNTTTSVSLENNERSSFFSFLDRIIAFLTDLRNRLAGTGDDGDTDPTPTDTPDTGADTPEPETETTDEAITETPTQTEAPDTATETPSEVTTTELPVETTAETPDETATTETRSQTTEVPSETTEVPNETTTTERPTETTTKTPNETTITETPTVTVTGTPNETTATETSSATTEVPTGIPNETTEAPNGTTATEQPTQTTTPERPTETPNETTTTETSTETTTETPTQTTATEQPTETTTETPNETTATEQPTETPSPSENASVVFDDQTSSGQQVTIAEATLPETGEVRVTDAGGNVLGTTDLPAGENTDVSVQLDPPLTGSQTLTADLFDSQGNVLQNANGETATDTAEVTVPVIGATRAPDLTDVSDFRTGETSSGETATLADFTFDQPVDVVGDASNFNLVPITNSGDPTALDGTGEVLDVENDTVTIAFIDDRAEPEGPFDGSIIARGFVDAGTVQPPNVSGTTNPLEAEPVNNNGNSESPDIIAIERNVGNNSLLFEFDEPVNSSDTSGFNYYTQDGSEVSSVENVVPVDETTLEVRFTLDSPVTDAVGGSTEADAVVGEGPSEDANLPDEELVTGETGADSSSIGESPLSVGGLGLVGLLGASALFARKRQ